jgi:Domain of unknown function (DUF4349)
MNRFRRIGVIVGVLFVAAWAIGCASGAGGNNSGSGAGAHAAVRGPEQALKANATRGAIGSLAASNGANLQRDTSLPQIGPKIIKTADVDVALPRGRFQDGLQKAIQIAGRYGGFVLSTTVATSVPPTGTVVIRVPATRFEAAVADIKGLGRVRRENVSGQDVSQDFIDLQARLRNAKAQEVVLLRLMDRAKTVSATIRVEQELEGVQLTIERLKGQLRYLGSQTAMSTITVGLSQVGVVAHRDSSLQKAWQRAGAALLSVISSVIVGAAYVLPVGLLALLVLMAVRWWRPKMST